MNRKIDPSGMNPTVLFAGVDLPVAFADGSPRIIFRYVVDDLSMEHGGALAGLKSRSWAELSMTPAFNGRGYRRRMVTISAATFLIWISRLTYVPKGSRAKLDAYQAEVHKLLASQAGDVFTIQEPAA